MHAYVEMKILKESTIAEIFSDYEQENIERCPDCGSSIFRIYDEPVDEGVYEQTICAVCGHRVEGWLNNFELDEDSESVSGRICVKCGDSLERRHDISYNYEDHEEQDDVYGMEEIDNDKDCTNEKCVDEDCTILFRKATAEEIKKIDDICMDIVGYMEKKYGDLSVSEIYMILQNLVRSFEDFTKSAYGRTIKITKDSDVTNNDFDNIMYG